MQMANTHALSHARDNAVLRDEFLHLIDDVNCQVKFKITFKLLPQTTGKPVVSMKKSRLPEVVKYWRHCVKEGEQAQSLLDWFQK